MERREGTVSEPGRARDSETNRAGGAADAGVMPKRFEGSVAPSGELDVTGGIWEAMMEFIGGARPKTPEKSGSRGSLLTESAAESA